MIHLNTLHSNFPDASSSVEITLLVWYLLAKVKGNKTKIRLTWMKLKSLPPNCLLGEISLNNFLRASSATDLASWGLSWASKLSKEHQLALCKWISYMNATNKQVRKSAPRLFIFQFTQNDQVPSFLPHERHNQHFHLIWGLIFFKCFPDFVCWSITARHVNWPIHRQLKMLAIL